MALDREIYIIPPGYRVVALKKERFCLLSMKGFVYVGEIMLCGNTCMYVHTLYVPMIFISINCCSL
jgi:hypothetical protein